MDKKKIKKKIMIVSFWVSPVESSGANRINSFVEYLSKKDWEIILIRPDFQKKFVINHSQFFFSEDKFINYPKMKIYNLPGIDIIALIKKTFRLGGRLSEKISINDKNNRPSIFKKLFLRLLRRLNTPDSLYLFWYHRNKSRVLKIYQSEMPDIVLTSAMPISCHFFGAFLNKKVRAVWVADYRDLYVDNISMQFEDNIIKKLIQDRFLKRCSLITTVSKNLKSILEKQAGYSKKCVVIYNGHEKSKILPVSLLKDRFLFASKKNEPVSLYAGTLYSNQYSSFCFFLEFIKKSTSLELFNHVIVGNNDKKKLLSLIATSEQHCFQERFDIKESIPFENMLKLYQEASLLVLFDYEQNGNLSSKVFEYFRLGIPVAIFSLSPNSELSLLVKSLGGIMISSAYDASSFEVDYRNFNVNQDYFHEFSRESQVKHLHTELLMLL